MTRDAAPRLIRIFLSSPGDVADERAIARTVLHNLGDDPLLRDRVTLRAIAWDDPSSRTPMLATLTPQEAINQGLPKPSECDIVIVIFWARMGTPLPDAYKKPDGSRYLSGTEWEYEDAERAAQTTDRPLVVVYRRTEKVLLDDEAPDYVEQLEQKRRVRAFFERFHAPDGSIRGGYNPYETPDAFRQALENDLKVLIQRVLEQLEARDTTPSVTREELQTLWPEGKSPFPGLRAFQPEDAPVFFGRGKETDALLKHVSASRFVAVVSASGAGKSSLVGAGLIPRLLANAISGNKDWRWLRFTPGEVSDNPFVALAVQLAPLIQGSRLRDVAVALRGDPESLRTYCDQALARLPEWAELLLFIDQFEELFTVVHPDHRAAFVALLDRATQIEKLRTVATLRADFTHRCIEYPTLAQLLNSGTFMLAAPEQHALHEMITRPAAVARLEFENDLAWRILDDTGLEPGALALTAYTLDELYQDCCASTNGLLSYTAYETLGGVQGAIGTRAENTFAGLDTDAQNMLPHVFRGLVEVDERGTATRQRALLARFEGHDTAWRLLERFTEARLLTTSRLGNDAVIEVAHEALFRSWPRLAVWIEETQVDLFMLRQLRQATELWVHNRYSDDFMWVGQRLKDAQVMVERLRPRLNEDERAFLRSEVERLEGQLQEKSLDHATRAGIGERLHVIGDTRPGVGLRDGLPDIVWCPVPGGTIALERNAGTFSVGPFEVAKYPVTRLQFQAFVDDPEGFANPEWWHGLVADKEHKYAPDAPSFRLNNNPRDNVSWYNAVVFCRWLSAKLNESIRLPTEWEWQQVATGGDPSYEYPWGSDWDGTRCNTYESGLSRTTAVGMYPHGASPVGALDMSGNVGEWCLNEYDTPANTSMDGNARRVVRGGSWADKQYLARAAYRDWRLPGDRGNLVGFRLVRVPHL